MRDEIEVDELPAIFCINSYKVADDFRLALNILFVLSLYLMQVSRYNLVYDYQN